MNEVETLREAEIRLRALVDASSDVVYRMSADWTEMRPLNAFGLIADARTPTIRWLEEYVFPEDRPRVVAVVEEAIEAKGMFAMEHRVRRRDGTIGWTLSRAIPILDSNGEIAEWFGTAADLTHDKRVQRRIEESEERLRTAIEVGHVGLWDWNLRTNEIHWSDEHYRLQGYAIGEVTPSYEAWTARIHPDDRQSTETALQHAMETRSEYAHEFRTVHTDGSVHWHSGRGRFIYDDLGKPMRMIGAIVDITERHRWDERQKLMIAELQHRTRNLMGVVRAIAEQTAENSSDLADFRMRFAGRLAALARVHGLLSRLNDNDRVTFDDLLRTELAAVAGPLDRVTLKGPGGIRLRSSIVQTLAMAIHELVINAVRYGAFSEADAHLAVTWSLKTSESSQHACWLDIDWHETGVFVPSAGFPLMQRTGYGRELIEEGLEHQLNAKTTFSLSPDGLRCQISIPIQESLD